MCVLSDMLSRPKGRYLQYNHWSTDYDKHLMFRRHDNNVRQLQLLREMTGGRNMRAVCNGLTAKTVVMHKSPVTKWEVDVK